MRRVHYGELLYHASVFTMFTYAITMTTGLPAHMITYGGRMKYYTFWNLCLAVIYYGIATIVDIIHLFICDQSHGVRKSRDYVFCSLVVPASLNVSLAFWIIYSINPEFVLPQKLQIYMPVLGFYNQAVHTGPVVTTLIEAFLVFHIPPSRFLTGCVGGLVYGTAYAAWVYYIAFKAGFWVYPFMTAMTDLQRVVYFGVCYVFGFFCYYLGVSTIRKVWDSELRDFSKNNKKKR